MTPDPTGYGEGPNRVGCRRGMLLVAFLLLATRVNHAHPAHAKPVNYPFVVGFERFHSGLDDEDYLAEGGFLLLNELNCVACHAAPEPLRNQFPGVVATNLEGVASRLAPVELEIFIRNPRFAKRDTTMPSLFAGPDRDLDEVAALRTWLGTLTVDLPDYPVGDIEKGRALYHRIGCVACHAPENGYRPRAFRKNAEIEDGRSRERADEPRGFLRSRGAHPLPPPSERASSLRAHAGLRPPVADAADLAAYLKAGPDLVLPDNLTEALVGRAPAGGTPAADPALVSKGRELFFTKQCHACHRVPESRPPPLPPNRPRGLSQAFPPTPREAASRSGPWVGSCRSTGSTSCRNAPSPPPSNACGTHPARSPARAGLAPQAAQLLRLPRTRRRGRTGDLARGLLRVPQRRCRGNGARRPSPPGAGWSVPEPFKSHDLRHPLWSAGCAVLAPASPRSHAPFPSRSRPAARRTSRGAGSAQP